MPPGPADYTMVALCLWREARGQGQTGMRAVACVLRNRVQRHKTSYYTEVVRPWQFSSMTAAGDPQLVKYPDASDVWWTTAFLIAGDIIDQGAPDITNGATLYYDDSIGFPKSWDKNKVVPLGKIGRFYMFREVA